MDLRSIGSGIGPRARLIVLLGAILGAGAGVLVGRRPASACTCEPLEWQVRLQAVTSSDPAADHRPFWPVEGRLLSWEGHVHVWASSGGVIARAGADR